MGPTLCTLFLLAKSVIVLFPHFFPSTFPSLFAVLIMSPPCAIEVEAVTDTEGYAISLPLKVNEIRNRRKIHQKSQWGVAAPSSSDQFKHNPDPKNKPKAKRWDR